MPSDTPAKERSKNEWRWWADLTAAIRLAQVLRRWGLQVDCRQDGEWKESRQYLGDGVFRSLSGSFWFSHVVHDLAHWLVATAGERRLPNFGLGESPDDGFACTERLPSTTQEDVTIEVWASALGIAYEALLGVDWAGTADEQNWLEFDKLVLAWKTLRKRGLLTANGIPSRCPPGAGSSWPTAP